MALYEQIPPTLPATALAGYFGIGDYQRIATRAYYVYTWSMAYGIWGEFVGNWTVCTCGSAV